MRGPEVGLAVFFQVLYDSNVAPRKLEIATDLDYGTIITTASTAVVHQVCQYVEDLTLEIMIGTIVDTGEVSSPTFHSQIVDFQNCNL